MNAPERSFLVRLARSGKTVEVPVGLSVVEALAEAGVDIMTSCGQGICGTCLTPVLDGEVEHHDSYLSPDEQAAHDQFLPCCSRAAGESLTLDL
jgi:vanillate monooxygenase ferredoxin subunit